MLQLAPHTGRPAYTRIAEDLKLLKWQLQFSTAMQLTLRGRTLAVLIGRSLTKSERAIST
jgi:hypothetical protein